jgi:hypothetical protein
MIQQRQGLSVEVNHSRRRKSSLCAEINGVRACKHEEFVSSNDEPKGG